MIQEQLIKKSTALKMRQIVILLNVQIMQVSIVNKIKQDDHILLQKKSEQLFYVIKNKPIIIQLFNLLNKLAKKYSSTENQQKCQKNLQSTNKQNSPDYEVVIVSFSSKPVDSIYTKVSIIDAQLAKKIVYFDFNSTNYPNIRPNRSFLSFNKQLGVHTITYGQGYSQLKQKQQLRLCVQSVFDLHDKNQQIFFIQTVKAFKDEQKQLKKQKFLNVWSLQNYKQQKDGKPSFQKQINLIANQHHQSKQNQSGKQRISTSYYLSNLKKQRKPQEFQQIAQNIQLNHFENPQSFNSNFILTQFLRDQKKSIFITPKSTIRSQNSRQISSFIFKNLSDHKLYLAKCSTPKKIGGQYYDQQLENRCFMSILPTIFNSKLQNSTQLCSLPFQRSSSMMKFSLLKAYEASKGSILVKPYLQNLTTLEKHSKEFYELIKSQDHILKGFGYLLGWSIITNQNFNTKDLLQQTSLIKQTYQKVDFSTKKITKIQYLTHQVRSIKDFIKQQSSQTKQTLIKLLRVDYFQPFQSRNSKLVSTDIQKQIKIRLTKQRQISINELKFEYIKQIYDLVTIISGQTKGNNLNENDFQQQSPAGVGLKLIKGLCSHYKWQYDKKEITDILTYRSNKLKLYLQKLIQQRYSGQKLPSYKKLQHNLLNQIIQKNALQLLLLIPQDYARFIKPLSPQQSPYYQFYPMNNKPQMLQNRYVISLLKKTHSFQIYGNAPSIFLLPNWIRSLYKYRVIEYISLLNATKEDYILVSKKLKMATAEKSTALLIVDHCQLIEEVFEEAKNVRTIFITRFKKGEHEMEVLYEQEEQKKDKQYLQDSNDQLINLLVDVYDEYFAGQQYDSTQSIQLNGPKEQQPSISKKFSVNPYLYKKYLFVYQTYIKIKSQFLKLNYQEALQFNLQLHKNISQSKNRYKEILQRYKTNDQWKYLYTLPIMKNNQKMTFIKNLHSFIEVHKFVDSLKQFTETRRQAEIKNKMSQNQIQSQRDKKNSQTKFPQIDPKCLPSLRQWIKFIDPEIKQEIVQNLLYLIKPLNQTVYSHFITSQKQQQAFKLVLMILQQILKPTSQNNFSILNTQQQKYNKKAYKIYNNLFCPSTITYQYPKQKIIGLMNLPVLNKNQNNQSLINRQYISQQLVNSQFYLILNNQRIVVYRFSNNLYINKMINQKVLQVEGLYKSVQGLVQIQKVEINEVKFDLKLLVQQKNENQKDKAVYKVIQKEIKLNNCNLQVINPIKHQSTSEQIAQIINNSHNNQQQKQIQNCLNHKLIHIQRFFKLQAQLIQHKLYHQLNQQQLKKNKNNYKIKLTLNQYKSHNSFIKSTINKQQSELLTTQLIQLKQLQNQQSVKQICIIQPFSSLLDKNNNSKQLQQQQTSQQLQKQQQNKHINLSILIFTNKRIYILQSFYPEFNENLNHKEKQQDVNRFNVLIKRNQNYKLVKLVDLENYKVNNTIKINSQSNQTYYHENELQFCTLNQYNNQHFNNSNITTNNNKNLNNKSNILTSSTTLVLQQQQQSYYTTNNQKQHKNNLILQVKTIWNDNKTNYLEKGQTIILNHYYSHDNNQHKQYKQLNLFVLVNNKSNKTNNNNKQAIIKTQHPTYQQNDNNLQLLLVKVNFNKLHPAQTNHNHNYKLIKLSDAAGSQQQPNNYYQSKQSQQQTQIFQYIHQVNININKTFIQSSTFQSSSSNQNQNQNQNKLQIALYTSLLNLNINNSSQLQKQKQKTTYYYQQPKLQKQPKVINVRKITANLGQVNKNINENTNNFQKQTRVHVDVDGYLQTTVERYVPNISILEQKINNKDKGYMPGDNPFNNFLFMTNSSNNNRPIINTNYLNKTLPNDNNNKTHTNNKNTKNAYESTLIITIQTIQNQNQHKICKQNQPQTNNIHKIQSTDDNYLRIFNYINLNQ